MISVEPMTAIKKLKSVLCLAAASSESMEIKEYFENKFGKGELIKVKEMEDFVIKYVDPETSAIWHLAGLSFQGQTEAAVMTGKLFSALKPTITMMVGMCMGMPSRGYPVGTVIVPNEIFSFDHVRITKNVQYRPHGQKVSNSIYKLAKLVGQDKELSYKVISDKGLASANSKIENAQAKLIQHIEKNFSDAVAYDMEGWGFFSALDAKRCIWIKGVSDSGESQIHNYEGQLNKKSIQGSATNNAISFAVAVVRAYSKVEEDQEIKKAALISEKNDIFLTSTDRNGNLVYKTPEEVVTYDEKMRSVVMDVIKINAHTHIIGVRSEYAWLHKNYKNFKMVHQKLSTLDLIKKTSDYDPSQIHFDIVKIKLEDGREKEIYFDISSFFMSGMISSIMDRDEFAAQKISDLYN